MLIKQGKCPALIYVFFFFLPRRNIIFENPVRNGILREKGLIHGVLDHVTLLHKNNQNFLGPNTGAFSANSQTLQWINLCLFPSSVSKMLSMSCYLFGI